MTVGDRVYLGDGVFATIGEFGIKLATDRAPDNDHPENTIFVDERVLHALIHEAQRAGWSVGHESNSTAQERLLDWYERREQWVRRLAGAVEDAGDCDEARGEWRLLVDWEMDNPRP